MENVTGLTSELDVAVLLTPLVRLHTVDLKWFTTLFLENTFKN